MNAKLRVLAQSLISELNDSSGEKDAEPSKTGWWRQLDWESPDSRTLFNSLGEETQKLIIEAGLVKDNPVSEEAQGNAAPMTPSKRAQMFFSIPEEIWEGLSEEEKDDYISRLPPEKERAGGEEMSDRDCVYQWDEIREKLLQKVPDPDRVKSEPVMLSRILEEMKFDGDSVTVTAETMDKLREYGIDLEPCERDEEEEVKEDILEESAVEGDADETEEELVKGDTDPLKDAERIWSDKLVIMG